MNNLLYSPVLPPYGDYSVTESKKEPLLSTEECSAFLEKRSIQFKEAVNNFKAAEKKFRADKDVPNYLLAQKLNPLVHDIFEQFTEVNAVIVLSDEPGVPLSQLIDHLTGLVQATDRKSVV